MPHINKKRSLLEPRNFFKPFDYPKAYEIWELQEQLHWLPGEVPMADDVKDWHTVLNANEKNLLTQIFRFFTQADIEVHDCYAKKYLSIFKPVEIQMMLSSFLNMETVHIAAYAHLLDTLGIPEVEYQAFMNYKEMRDKYEYMQQFNVDSKMDIAYTMAVYGAFTEGLQLFASFAMLLNFQRFGKMKGMGQIVAWSVRDETLHTDSIIWLFHTFIRENKELWCEELKEKLYEACRTIISHEDAFVDLAFEMGGVEGMTSDDIKQYIRFIANRRLTQLKLEPIYDVKSNPLPWLDEILNSPEHVNFFENRATEYSRAATTGTWDEAFASLDKN